jgi:hypothetical protein
LNGTPKKRKKKNGGQEHRETKYGEIDQRKNNKQKKKGVKKKTTGRGDGAKKRGFATQRRFALRKNTQPLGKMRGQAGRKESEVGPNPKK